MYKAVPLAQNLTADQAMMQVQRIDEHQLPTSGVTPNERRSSVVSDRLLMAMKKQVPTFTSPQRIQSGKRTSPLKVTDNSHSIRKTIGNQLRYNMHIDNQQQSTRSRVLRVEVDSSGDEYDDSDS